MSRPRVACEVFLGGVRETPVQPRSTATLIIVLLALCSSSGRLMFGQVVSRENPKKQEHFVGKGNPSDLLVRSYDLGKQFTPEERGMQLLRLINVGGKIHQSSAKSWAEEAFRTSGQVSISLNRLLLQRNVVVALAPYNSKRALQMLREMDLPVPNKEGVMPEDLRVSAAGPAFRSYWKQVGRPGLPALRALAIQMGDTGQYPFSAMLPIILELSKREPLQASSLIAEAQRFYDRGSRSNSADGDFVAFIEALAPDLSHEELRSLLESAVNKLAEKKKTDGSFHVQVYTNKGSAIFDSKSDELLFEILPLIAEIDPQWDKRLRSEDQQLAQAAGVSGVIQRTEAVSVYGTSDATVIARLSQEGMERARLNDIAGMAMEHPAQALALASSISDSGMRSIALSDVATGYSKEDPQMASALLTQAKQSTLQLTNLSQREAALAALSRAASATRNIALFREIFERAFDLGEELFQEDLDSHPGQTALSADAYEDLSTLVQAGISVDVEITMARLSACTDSVLQAYLLIDAAAALAALPKNQEN